MVAPGDVAQLSFAMQEIAGDSSLRDRMAQDNRSLIRNFSPEACAAGIANAAMAETTLHV